ncbi:helix-turn-helix domain-containing protein, partial [Actinokineospora inagensis]|uniref:helix-turn-helix domain-containing protein n=2 Tax=Actinokineospora inagensis TaxID=103730 RepID=UPI003CCBF5C0
MRSRSARNGFAARSTPRPPTRRSTRRWWRSDIPPSLCATDHRGRHDSHPSGCDLGRLRCVGWWCLWSGLSVFTGRSADRRTERASRGMTVEDPGIGRRVREIRVRRGMTMSVTAGLAGISQSYLSMIEHGRRAVEKRSLVEGLAEALRVSPAELSGKPCPADDRGSRLVAAALDDIGDTLTGWWVDEVPEIAVRPWEEV